MGPGDSPAQGPEGGCAPLSRPLSLCAHHAPPPGFQQHPLSLSCCPRRVAAVTEQWLPAGLSAGAPRSPFGQPCGAPMRPNHTPSDVPEREPAHTGRLQTQGLEGLPGDPQHPSPHCRLPLSRPRHVVPSREEAPAALFEGPHARRRDRPAPRGSPAIRPGGSSRPLSEPPGHPQQWRARHPLGASASSGRLTCGRLLPSFTGMSPQGRPEEPSVRGPPTDCCLDGTSLCPRAPGRLLCWAAGRHGGQGSPSLLTSVTTGPRPGDLCLPLEPPASSQCPFSLPRGLHRGQDPSSQPASLSSPLICFLCSGVNEGAGGPRTWWQ